MFIFKFLIYFFSKEIFEIAKFPLKKEKKKK